MSKPEDIPKDVTDTLPIERLELFEERLGVYLDALYILYEVKPYNNQPFNLLIVMGELYAKNGSGLEQDIDLIVTVYNSSGRVIGLESKYFSKSTFFGLEAFRIQVQVYEMPAKIRIYPQNN